MTRLVLAGFGPIASVAALVSGCPALAQDNREQPNPAPSDRSIVVTADRAVVEALRGVTPEREYDQQDVAAYGSSTVGDFVGEVQAENGDDNPTYLINGEPASGIDDVSDYPAEAVERVEVLPRGSGQRIGRPGDQRVYNVVLKQQVRSATLAAGRKDATEGAWGQTSGEAILSSIKGRRRLNLALHARDSDRLTEDDRDIVQPDPATVTGPADYYEPIDAGAFRTLRGPSRNYDASLIGGLPLTSWLNSMFSLVGRINDDGSWSGLPDRQFLLPGSSPYSPTGTDQTLVLFGPAPLVNHQEQRSLNGSLTLNASRGSWIGSFTAQLGFSSDRYANDRLDRNGVPDPVIVPPGRNPFVDPLDDFFPATVDRAKTDERSWLLKLDVGGPLFRLPAGDLRLRASVQRDGDHSHSVSGLGGVVSDRVYERATTSLSGGIDIPLASEMFLAPLGQLTLSLDGGRFAVDRMPDLDRSSATLLWQPTRQFSVTGFIGKDEDLPAVELFADPVVVYTNVQTFDFLTGETAEVTLITGGNPALKPLSRTTHRLSFSAAPWQRYNLQLNLDYEGSTVRSFAAGVPPASSPVFLAFPERFQRDADGRLVLVDSRAVNFDREERQDIHWSLSFSLPVGKSAHAAEGGAASGPQPRLQFALSDAIALKDKVTIRAGLPVIDVLEGGAVGIAGGRPRHVVTGSVTYSDATMGARLTGFYRSQSTLLAGTPAAPENLRFAPIFTASLRAYAELQPLLGQQWLENTRLSFAVENIANRRQRVTDDGGLTPLRYQSAYRDPIGRTFEIELRKVF